MIPKNKAISLVDLMLSYVHNQDSDSDTDRWKAIKCAIIAVDEILRICTQSKFIIYWNEVEDELNKMLLII